MFKVAKMLEICANFGFSYKKWHVLLWNFGYILLSKTCTHAYLYKTFIPKLQWKTVVQKYNSLKGKQVCALYFLNQNMLQLCYFGHKIINNFANVFVLRYVWSGLLNIINIVYKGMFKMETINGYYLYFLL